MKLIWHIVRKDLARLTVPLSLWIAFVVVTTAWFGAAGAPVAASTAVAADLLGGWIGTLHGSGLAGVLFQTTVGALLAAVLVLEDLPAGSVAFWLTRPANGLRMVAGKSLGAALFFAVMPALALSVVWLAFGFTPGETAVAAVEYAGWQLGLFLPALAVAAMTGSLGRYAVGALLVWLIAVFTVIVGDDAKGGALLRAPLLDARGTAVVGILLVGSAAVFVQAYLRRRKSAWAVLATTLGLMILVRVTWNSPSQPERASRSDAGITMEWNRMSLQGEEPVLTMTVAASGRGSVVAAPVFGVLKVSPATGAPREYELERGRRWGEAAALRVAGLATAGAPLVWELGMGRARALAEELSKDRTVPPGEIRMAMMAGRVLWELPLRVGSEGHAQSAHTRILNIGWSDDRSKRKILLQERDARLALHHGIRKNTGGRSERRRDADMLDCFLLVNRSRGYARAVEIGEFGAARMHSLRVSARVVEIEPAAPAGAELAAWDEGATLVKVRFSSAGTEVRSMPGGKITIEEANQR